MQALKNYVVPLCFHIQFWARYVDDVFAIIRINRLEEMLSKIKLFHTDIKLTCFASMHNDQLPFLDTLMTVKEDFFFGFQVYRKPTHTDKYLQWNSNHQTCHRLYVIHTLV